MLCPICQERDLTSISAGDVTLDVCQGGCGGIWFDAQELDKINDSNESVPDSILNLTIAKVPTDRPRILKCPSCPDEVLIQQFYDPKNEVSINQCWTCSGIWLDQGELQKIRAQFSTAQDRKKAVDNYVTECIETQIKTIEIAGIEGLKRYNEDHANRFKAVVSSIKKILL